MTTLRVLTADECEVVRQWRNLDLSPWRTPYYLTEEQQQDFYREVVCNRNTPHRFWAVDEGGRFAGMVGLTNIQWENRTAELNLIMGPDMHKLADAAVDLLLEQAFDFVGLLTVCGECYLCSPQLMFWRRKVEGLGAYSTTLPKRKLWQGKMWDSLWFSIVDADYRHPKGEGV
jgi:hypothetical protein